jgi:hypothetical protein
VIATRLRSYASGRGSLFSLLYSEQPSVRATEHLGEVELVGRRRQDVVLAGHARSERVLVGVRPCGQVVREQNELLVAKLATRIPAPPPSVEPRPRAALRLSVQAGLGIEQARGGERRIDPLAAGGERVLDNDVVQVVGGDDRQPDLDRLCDSDSVQFGAALVLWAVRRDILALDNDASMERPDVFNREADAEMRCVVEGSLSLAAVDDESVPGGWVERSGGNLDLRRHSAKLRIRRIPRALRLPPSSR